MAQDFYKEMDIEWWRTPAESPDLNPIENMWHELKEVKIENGDLKKNWKRR